VPDRLLTTRHLVRTEEKMHLYLKIANIFEENHDVGNIISAAVRPTSIQTCLKVINE